MGTKHYRQCCRVFYYGVARPLDKSIKTIVKSYDEAKSLYAETSKRHKATLAYAINKDGRYANMNHLNDFRPERDKNE